MPASATLETEKALADAWGLTMKDLAEVRRQRLRKDYHWVLENSTVMYTPEGIAALRDWGIVPQARALENAGEVPIAQVGVLTVSRVPANPRMILAVDSNGLFYRIRVSANRNFKRGMQFQLPPDSQPDALGLYQFKGRLPRFYGRW